MAVGIFGIRPPTAAAAAAAGFTSGTKMLFQQTNAPDGWTKDTTHNDKSLRVVSGAAGSGGATAFSSVFGSGKASASYVLLEADIPAHDHTAGTLAAASSGSHGHGMDMSSGSTGSFNAGEHLSTLASAWATGTGGGTNVDLGIVAGGAHTHSVSGSVADAGGDGGHTHDLSLDLNFVDVIIATKN